MQRKYSIVVLFCCSILLSSCDHEWIRDNPLDAGSLVFQPGLRVEASHGGAEWVELTWPDLPATTGFIVERSWDESDFIEVARLDGLAMSYRDSTDRAGTYRYRVTRDTSTGQRVTTTTSPITMGNWLETKRRPVRRGYVEYAGELPDGRILFFKPDDSSQEDALVFDPATFSWTSAPPLSLSRMWSISLLPDGRILVLGGSGGEYYNLWEKIELELFDPATMTWKRLPAPPHPAAEAYVPFAIEHLGGFDVLVSFQAAAWQDHHFMPRRFTDVLPVAYVLDIETGRYREVSSPDTGGPGTLARIAGSVRSREGEARAFGTVECSETAPDSCRGGTCEWTYDLQSDTWTKKCPFVGVMANLLPVVDYIYLSLRDDFTFLLRDNIGIGMHIQSLNYPQSYSYFQTPGHYVIGGNPVMVVGRNPFTFSIHEFSQNMGTNTTNVLLSDGRLLATNPVTGRSMISRHLSELPNQR